MNFRDSEDAHCGAPPGGLFRAIQNSHPLPLSVVFVLTDACHLACPHCYNASAPAGRGSLSTGAIFDILDQLAAAGTLHLAFTGGEPCLHPDFDDILRGALKRRFAVTVKTSGPARCIERLTDWRAWGLARVDCSLYSAEPSHHDRFVGRPSAFVDTVAFMRRFVALGGRARVGIVVMDWNAGEVTAQRCTCEDNGLEWAVDLRVSPGLDGNMGPCGLRADEAALEAVLADRRLRKGSGTVDRTPLPADTIVCGAGRDTACIRPDGEVWPCLTLPLSMGNLRDRTWTEIMASPVRQRVSSLRWGDQQGCVDCAVSWACRRCPADAFQETGDLNAVCAIDCLLARLQARERGDK